MKKQIKEIATYIQPWKYRANQLLPFSFALNPVLTANKHFILGSTFEKNVFSQLPAVIFDDFTTDVKYVDFPFLVRSSALKIILNKDRNLSTKFIYYLLKSLMYKPFEHKRQYISTYQNYFVDIDYSQTQNIVNKLDIFDKQIESLNKKLNKFKSLYSGGLEKFFSSNNKEFTPINLHQIVHTITTGKLDANAMKPDGQYRFYTCSKKYFYIDKYAFDGEALLISGNGNVGYIHHYKGKFNAYQRTYVLMNFDCNVLYLKGYLEHELKKRIAKEVRSGNIPYITYGTLANIEVKIPNNNQDIILLSNFCSIYEKLIEKTEKLIEKYTNLRNGILFEMFAKIIKEAK